MAGYPARSIIVWKTDPSGPGETPRDILESVVARLRSDNADPDRKARELSLAITHCEEAMHWLLAYETRRSA